MRKKSPYYTFVRGFCTLMAIMGLFCVLSGCSFSFRDASEPDPFFESMPPETDPVPETMELETENTITGETETQKVDEPETEETM